MRRLLKQKLRGVWLALRRGISALLGDGWRQAVLRLLLAASLMGSLGFVGAWIGLVPVGASGGHWPITDWFLHFTMRNSVQTSALGIKKPTLDDDALVLMGAGHYATGCAPCHGAPGNEPSLVVQQTTPKPPVLPPRIGEWKPEQLFWIVKHGVKFTAMPAWGNLKRDDEVWAMVAFLQQMPDMTEKKYRHLAFGDSADSPIPDQLSQLDEPLGPVLGNCARCHGADGLGRGKGAFPRLAGQSEAYLFASLQAYATGKRHSGIMQAVATGLSEATQRALARHYAALEPPVESARRAEPDAIERGRAIAEQGVHEMGIPACAECHGPDTGSHNPVYPSLSGQYPNYLALQLSLFKKNARGGTPYAHIMQQVASQLTPEQVHDVTLFYGSLSWQPRDGEIGNESLR